MNLINILKKICGTFSPDRVFLKEDMFKDIKLYLPKYLSEKEQENLFKELSEYPQNLDKRLYSSFLDKETNYFQGDGYANVSAPNFSRKEFANVKGFLISNTCDVSSENKRMYEPSLTFAPIINLEKYENGLKMRFKEAKVQAHINSIRSQLISSMFYLPKSKKLGVEAFAKLDALFSLPSSSINKETFLNERLFVLSNYGYYLLLFKLSVHFTRVQEGVRRDAC